MNRNIFWEIVLVFSILVGWISQQPANSIGSLNTFAMSDSKLIATEAGISQLVKANNRFGFDLFSQLQTQISPERNIFISPQSIAIALSMTRNGTRGEALAEIERVLGLEDLDSDKIDSSYSKLTEILTTADPSIELAIANSLWANQNIELEEEFVERTQNFYRGKVTNLDFNDPAALDTINGWVASNTSHKITKIIDSLSPNNALYLINAIYFQGDWAKKFDPRQTTERPFYTDLQTSKPVAMMSQTGEYRYYANEQFQAVRIPYGERKEIGMYIFLPQTNSSLEKFNQQLNIDNWQEWLSQMRSQRGNIYIPKFKLEYDTELKAVLSALGMQRVFNSQADFSAMTDVSVAIDTVKHKAVIEVNEEGTEAAGVTSIGIRITSAMPDNQPFNFDVDRPFFLAIEDDITETILFMGNVVEP